MEEGMTDFQFKKLLEMILKILDGSKTLEEARAALNELLKEEKNLSRKRGF